MTRRLEQEFWWNSKVDISANIQKPKNTKIALALVSYRIISSVIPFFHSEINFLQLLFKGFWLKCKKKFRQLLDQWNIRLMEHGIQKFGIKHEMTVSLALVVRQKNLTPVFQSKSDDSEIRTRFLMKFKSWHYCKYPKTTKHKNCSSSAVF